MAYLTPNDENAFLDIPLKTKYPNDKAIHPCPKCKGHGYWNLVLNSYGQDKHFQSGCSQCDSWGFVEDPNECIHTYESSYSRLLSTFEHEYRCSKCNKTIILDSSG